MANLHKWVCVSAAVKGDVVALVSNGQGRAFVGSYRMQMDREQSTGLDENQRRKPRKQVLTLSGPTRWLSKAIKNGGLKCHKPSEKSKSGATLRIGKEALTGYIVLAPGVAEAMAMFDMGEESSWSKIKPPPKKASASDGKSKQAPKAKTAAKPKPKASKPAADAPAVGE